MTCVLVPLLVAAATFLEQDIPGLHVGRADPLSGRVSGNFRRADLDGDGATDLVLPTYAAFQKNGAYHRDNRAPIPYNTTGAAADELPDCDIWREARPGRLPEDPPQLYLRFKKRLVVMQWRPQEGDSPPGGNAEEAERGVAGEWQHVLNQDIEWPAANGPEAPAELLASKAGGGLQFRSFLQDLNGDGQPEIVLASGKGVHIYARKRDFYREARRLDLFPSLGLAAPLDQELWPAASRSVEFPLRQMMCRLLLEGPRVCVITREVGADGGGGIPAGGAPREEVLVRYRITRHLLAGEDDYAIVDDASTVHVTEPLPAFFEPCRLNQDETIDYAGARWSASTFSAAPARVCQTGVSTDGGRTYRILRSESFKPQCLFVDFDGDGDADMVMERTGLFRGGLRESVNRFMTQRKVRHEVQIHFQDISGRFSSTPDVRGRFTLVMDRVLLGNGEVFRRYQAGELVNLTGDFNGDGQRDAVVQDAGDRLSLYLSQDQGFSTRPDATVQIRDEWRFAVADVDGDGRSDIIVRWVDTAEGAPREERSRVFLARETPL